MHEISQGADENRRNWPVIATEHIESVFVADDSVFASSTNMSSPLHV